MGLFKSDVTSAPPDTVYWNTRAESDQELVPGRYVVTIEVDGFDSVVRTVDVVGSDVCLIDVVLYRAGGSK
jgi:hypothetical protein